MKTNAVPLQAPPSDTTANPLSRRDFLTRAGAATVAAGLGTRPGLAAPAAQARPQPMSGIHRRNQAYQIRHEAALDAARLPLGPHPVNGDETRWPGYLGQFAKSLPHDALGRVIPEAYEALLVALEAGTDDAFEAVPAGGAMKLANPQAAYACSMEGADPWTHSLRAPPTFDSAEEAGEMAEVYWQALTRDVGFADYASHPLIAQAAADLALLSDFRGPTAPHLLFRGTTPGDLTGPYLSQFLYLPVPAGPRVYEQRNVTTFAGSDHLTDTAAWLAVVNGAPAGPAPLDSTRRYIRNGRDLAEYVHRDYACQAYLDASLIILSFGPAAWDPANPYLRRFRQGPFVTLGAADFLDFVSRAAREALKAAWFQKWCVHRRLRPEEFAGRVHYHILGIDPCPIHPELLQSQVLPLVAATHGSYLLPQAYPEGSPTHPSYPAGHAAIAGACATVLKAFVKEDFVIPSPVVPAPDGLDLLAYSGPPLTLGGEVNKLASNIALGRDTAGVHWRSDGSEGLLLGEAVAIHLLRDWRRTLHEPFEGFSLTLFDGTAVTV